MASKSTPQLIGIAILLFAGCIGQAQNNTPSPDKTSVSTAPQKIIGSRCIFCHREEVEGYSHSAMAHSLRVAGEEPEGTVKVPNGTISVHSSRSVYWQSLETPSGSTSYRIDYVIGSGNHASGYLLDLAGHLFQSPLAYYKSRHAYDLAPGYENVSDPDFNRPVTEACLFCHSGSALHIAGTSNHYRFPPFAAEAITCERCHGPAEKHLSDPRAGTIINPAKLDRAPRDSICEQCHLLGVGRVLNPGKQFSDFRAGEPLEAVFTTYVNAPPPGSAEKFKVISHVEQLARSVCSQQSKGKLWCGTCHNPHEQPVEPISYYRSKCLSCHTGNFPTAHPDRESNCIGCHMPRRNAKDGGHTAFTDHRIQRRPTVEAPLPEDVDIAAWREPDESLQKRNLGIAYINVGGERRSPEFIVRGYRMLTEIQQQFSNDSAFFTAIGTALLIGKHPNEAEFAFDRAVELEPQSATAKINAASAYLAAGDLAKAQALFESALVIDPLDLSAAVRLNDIYRQRGDQEKSAALTARLSEAVQSQPSDVGPQPNSSESVPAASKFTNVQVLKGTPADQLIPTMRFISGSLGVECSYCHVQGHFERDDKKPKQIAREMMRMELTIDKDTFNGARQVTCYSCHRGTPNPKAIPVIADATATKVVGPVSTEPTALPTNLPTADEIVDRYIDALGGAAAIDGVRSRQETGTFSSGEKSARVELFDESPDRFATVRHMAAGDNITLFNDREGWSEAPGRPALELHGAELDAAQMDADLQFALHIRTTFDQLRVEYPETIGGHEAYVLSAMTPGKPATKFYFDEQSGLLIRLVRYAESALGLDPTQIDYGDYRNVDGVQLPFRWIISEPRETSTIQWEQVRQNLPIDDSRFLKPDGSAAKARTPAP